MNTHTNSSTFLVLNRKGLWLGCIILALFALAFRPLIIGTFEKEGTITERISLDDFPSQLGSWTAGEPIGLDIRSLDVLRLSSYVKRVYTNPEGKKVFLYIGYWASQTGEHQAAKHSPALCLPSNGWVTEHLDNFNFSFTDTSQNNVDLTTRRIKGEKRGQTNLFYYWFFAGEHYYTQEWYALINLSIENLLYNRNDGGIVEVATDLSRMISKEEAEVEANKTIQEFLNELAPYLHKKISAIEDK